MDAAVDLNDPAIRRKAAAARELAKDPAALLEASGVDALSEHRQKILDRLTEMPATMRRGYMKALRGKSTSAGIRAFCFMCMGWVRSEVPLCTDPACPLYPYRPT